MKHLGEIGLDFSTMRPASVGETHVTLGPRALTEVVGADTDSWFDLGFTDAGTDPAVESQQDPRPEWVSQFWARDASTLGVLHVGLDYNDDELFCPLHPDAKSLSDYWMILFGTREVPEPVDVWHGCGISLTLYPEGVVMSEDMGGGFSLHWPAAQRYEVTFRRGRATMELELDLVSPDIELVVDVVGIYDWEARSIIKGLRDAITQNDPVVEHVHPRGIHVVAVPSRAREMGQGLAVFHQPILTVGMSPHSGVIGWLKNHIRG